MKTPLVLARAQLAGGRPAGREIDRWFICQNCGVECHVDLELDPCAFCNDCKDAVLDALAQCVVHLRSQLPRSKR